MKKSNQKIKIVFAVFIMVFTCFSVLGYDYFKEKFNNTEVVIVKGEGIEKNEKLTKEMLAIEKRPKEDLVKNFIPADKLHTILDKEAAQNILENSVVSMDMLDNDHLIPDYTKGEAIRPIMQDMIYAKPGSLRRKDTIDIYIVDKQKLEDLNPNSFTSSKKEKASSEKTESFTEPLLKDVKVVYVKDSSNKEVTDSVESDDQKNQKNKEKGRLNATSSISDLEVILNETDFDLLMNEVVSKGNKLYITYK
ncbi:hypothetical protein [Bacillus altitudinis]|uniref:hypothetical protein n=1 Tax=Bacillus altitudinis TaxID=293387 RepID=UPI002F94693D